MIYAIAILLTLALAVWWYEPRIYLFLFSKIFFPMRTGKPLHVEKKVHFPEADSIESSWKTIRDEFTANSRQRVLPRFHEVDRANHKISFDNGPAWRTVVLKAYDGWFEDNCKRFPETYQRLKDIPSISTVMFSLLEPHVKIPAHTGKFSCIWRYHLALIVPDEPGCFMQVHDQQYQWSEGHGILFNDTFLHSVSNETSQPRLVLFLDIKKKASPPARMIRQSILFIVRHSPIFRRSLKAGLIRD